MGLLKEYNSEGRLNGLFDEILGIKENGEPPVNNDDIKLKEKLSFVSNYNEISRDNVVIGWEHYKTNYLDIDNSNKNDDHDDIDHDDDDDDDDGDNIVGMFPNLIRLNNEKQVHYTPWGKFDIDNPLSPINLYDIRVMHLRGFTTISIKNFPALINSIEGIAIWGQIDPYFVVIAMAKMYEFEDIKKRIEGAIYGALNIEIDDDDSELEEYILGAGEKSEKLHDDGIDNFVVVFPEPNLVTEILENPDEKKVDEIHRLMDQIEDLVVFKNGEFYER